MGLVPIFSDVSWLASRMTSWEFSLKTRASAPSAMFLLLLAHLSTGYVLIRLGTMIPHLRMTVRWIAAAGPSRESEKSLSHLTGSKQEGKGNTYKLAKPSGGMDY
jgi:hypothetical protein